MGAWTLARNLKAYHQIDYVSGATAVHFAEFLPKTEFPTTAFAPRESVERREHPSGLPTDYNAKIRSPPQQNQPIQGRTVRFTGKSFFGTAVCVASAIALSFLLNDDARIRLVGPLIGLLVVVATSFLCGRLAAIVGGSAASLAFAVFLFPPFGSIVVHDLDGRIELVAFQIAVVLFAYLTPPLPHDKYPEESPQVQGHHSKE
jgi:hypothetical protein